jgi:hypothetical protein
VLIILQAPFLVAQAKASTATGGDVTACVEALGRMTMAYTVGVTACPASARWLADKGDLYFSARLGVLSSLLFSVLSWLYHQNPEETINKQARIFSDYLKTSL